MGMKKKKLFKGYMTLVNSCIMDVRPEMDQTIQQKRTFIN